MARDARQRQVRAHDRVRRAAAAPAAALKQDLAAGAAEEQSARDDRAVLDDTLLRVGNEEYARSNKSYGLTTLRDHHVKFLEDGRAFFSFKGKSGRVQELVLDDRRLRRIIRHCQQLPGQQLFQYVDDEGQRQPSIPAWSTTTCAR